MSGEWKKVKLGDLVEINKSSIGRDFPFDEIEYIDTSSVTQNNFEKPQILSLLTAPSRAKRLVKKNDIIISTVRPIQRHYGFMKDVKPNTVVSTGFAVVTGIKINSLFLFYFLTQDLVTEYLDKIAESSTTTFPAFRPEILSDLELDLPPLSTQQKIAEILSSLDDKIELNRQTNATLEAMAQTLFKEWFVAPITEGVSEKSSLDEYIAFSPKLSIKVGQNVNYIEMRDLPTDSASISNMVNRPFTSGSKFQNGDTLMARITPCLENGKTGFVDLLEKNEIAFGSTEFIVMRAKEGVSPYFVYFVARDENFKQFAVSNMIGSSGRQRVSADILRTYQIDRVDATLMQRFDETVRPFFEKTRVNTSEIQTLQHLRDSLLPRLMKGELLI